MRQERKRVSREGRRKKRTKNNMQSVKRNSKEVSRTPWSQKAKVISAEVIEYSRWHVSILENYKGKHLQKYYEKREREREREEMYLQDER